MAFGWDDVVVAGIGLFGHLFGAGKQASAATRAAQLQTDAIRASTEAQARAAAEALTFQRTEADRAQANFETTQHANYDQWAAREGRIGSLGELVGLPSRQIPGYVSSGSLKQIGSGQTPAAAGVPKSTGDLAKDMALANKVAYGFDKHTDPSYWQKVGYDTDKQYFFEKMLGRDARGNDAPKTGPFAGMGNAPNASNAPGNVAPAAMARYGVPAPLLTPALMAPYVTYPGSLGSYR